MVARRATCPRRRRSIDAANMPRALPLRALLVTLPVLAVFAACASPTADNPSLAPLHAAEWLELEYHGRIALGESLSAAESAPAPSP